MRREFILVGKAKYYDEMSAIYAGEIYLPM